MTETTSSTPPKNPAGVASEVLPPAGVPASPAKPDRVTAVSNLALGTVLMALEALDGWLDHNVPTQAQALEQRAKAEGVLLPQSEWEAKYGRPEDDRVRLAAIGMAASASTQAVRATQLAMRTAGQAMDAARWPLDHIFLFRPLRHGVDRVSEARDQQIDQWVQTGRALDTGSRAVAQVSLSNAAEDSVDIVTVDPRVQALIQEIIAAQGTSITKETLREVREYSVSADMRVDQVWATLRARPKPAIVTPGFAVSIPDKKPDQKEMAGRPYLGGSYAGIASRVLAFSIDVFVLIVALVVGWVFLGAIVSMFDLSRFVQAVFGTNGHATVRIVTSGVVLTLAAGIYWIFGWMLTGATVGKLIMGLRVVGPGGSHLGFWRSVLRVIGYFICAFSLGLGFLWVIVNKRHHSWADKLAGSSVVYAWHARPDEIFLVGSTPQTSP